MPLKWRITQTWQKALYIVVGYAVIASVLFAIRTWLLNAAEWPYSIILVILNLAYVLIGVRIFRGYLEPLAPARAWWRWTGRPKAGFWLGAIFLWGTIGASAAWWLPTPHPLGVGVTALNVSVSGLTALGYFNSSIRLLRHPEMWSQRRVTALPAATPAE